MEEASDSESDDVTFDIRSIQKEQEESLLSKADKTVNRVVQRENETQYPKSVFLILGTEFCERFNYYGMRTILVIYLTEWLGQSFDSSVALFHLFGMLAYFSPLFGAILADGYLGRYRTILYVSMVYAAGTLVLSLTAFPPPELYGPVVGLLLISLGTGGIKPCVTAFGGDQFTEGQEKERMTFFSAFYFMINLGSMLSTLITPVLRADVHCIGDSCYPLAFGVPTVLMIISLLIFVSGSKHYRHVSPTGNLFGKVVSCVWYGARQRLKNGRKEGSHWLDYAAGQYEKGFVTDVKALLRVLWLFLPLPLFWALFDQQGSRWTLQAVMMNGDMGKFGRVKPDQMQVLNPVLILMLIPLFDKLIYPCMDWLRLPNRPVQRMCMGMFLCSVAFFVAGFVQIKLEETVESPLSGMSGVTIMNAGHCKSAVSSKFYSGDLSTGEMSRLHRVPPGSYSLTARCKGKHVLQQPAVTINLNTDKEKAYRVVIYQDNFSNISLNIFPDDRRSDKDGKAKVSIAGTLPADLLSSTVNVYLKESTTDKRNSHAVHALDLSSANASEFFTVEPGLYQVFINNQSTRNTLQFGSGSVHTIVITADSSNITQKVPSYHSLQFETVEERQVSMFWLVPQYVIITCGEILFSITGLSFAYSQAPSSMKSVLQAAWLMTVAFGDLIVVVVAETRLMSKQSSEFFMFAFLMVADTIVFGVMTFFYTRQQPELLGGEEIEGGDIVTSDSVPLVGDKGIGIRLDELQIDVKQD